MAFIAKMKTMKKKCTQLRIVSISIQCHVRVSIVWLTISINRVCKRYSLCTRAIYSCIERCKRQVHTVIYYIHCCDLFAKLCAIWLIWLMRIFFLPANKQQIINWKFSIWNSVLHILSFWINYLRSILDKCSKVEINISLNDDLLWFKDTRTKYKKNGHTYY